MSLVPDSVQTEPTEREVEALRILAWLPCVCGHEVFRHADGHCDSRYGRSRYPEMPTRGPLRRCRCGLSALAVVREAAAALRACSWLTITLDLDIAGSP